MHKYKKKVKRLMKNLHNYNLQELQSLTHSNGQNKTELIHNYILENIFAKPKLRQIKNIKQKGGSAGYIHPTKKTYQSDEIIQINNILFPNNSEIEWNNNESTYENYDQLKDILNNRYGTRKKNLTDFLNFFSMDNNQYTINTDFLTFFYENMYIGSHNDKNICATLNSFSIINNQINTIKNTHRQKNQAYIDSLNQKINNNEQELKELLENYVINAPQSIDLKTLTTDFKNNRKTLVQNIELLKNDIKQVEDTYIDESLNNIYNKDIVTKDKYYRTNKVVGEGAAGMAHLIKTKDNKFNFVIKSMDTGESSIDKYLSLGIIELYGEKFDDEGKVEVTSSQRKMGTMESKYITQTNEAFEQLIASRNLKEYFNLNKFTRIIQNTGKVLTTNDVMLFCKSDNFDNQTVLHFILNEILGNKYKIPNFIYQYDVFRCKKPDGTYTGYNVMEFANGSTLDQYINKIGETRFNGYQQENILKANIDEITLFFQKMLVQIFTTLYILQQPKYKFISGDFKTQNIFVHIGKDGEPIYKLADFDKSSITYKGVRFFNKGNFAVRNLRKTYTDINDYNKTDFSSRTQASDVNKVNVIHNLSTLEQDNIVKQINEDTYSIYSFYTQFKENINEPEVLVTRHSHIPYHDSFDIISFFISLMHCKLFNGLISYCHKYDKNNVIYKCFHDLFYQKEINIISGKKININFADTTISHYINKIKGKTQIELSEQSKSFVYLLQYIRENNIPLKKIVNTYQLLGIYKFMQNKNNLAKLVKIDNTTRDFVKNIKISSGSVVGNPKLCISSCGYYNNIQEENVRTFSDNGVNIWHNSNINNKIWNSALSKNTVCKTNRYAQTGILLVSDTLYDYDFCEKLDNPIINDYDKETKDNIEQIETLTEQLDSFNITVNKILGSSNGKEPMEEFKEY